MLRIKAIFAYEEDVLEEIHIGTVGYNINNARDFIKRYHNDKRYSEREPRYLYNTIIYNIEDKGLIIESRIERV